MGAAEEAAPEVTKVEGKIAGQSFSFSSPYANTLFTIAGAFAAGLCVYILYTHSSETKEASRDLAAAMREMASAARENTCIVRFEQKDRPANEQFCKQVSR